MSKRAVLFLSILVACGGGIAIAYNSGWFDSGRFDSNEKRFYQACVETLKERLKSPSSYKLIKNYGVRYDFTPYSVKWGLGWETPSEEAAGRNLSTKNTAVGMATKVLIEIAKRYVQDGDYYVATLVFKYEASNSFSAMISSSAICEIGVHDKLLPRDYGPLVRLDLRVNGKNSFDYGR